ncbi:methylated-DNA--[protein]-cysteine S-methyltransferase [Clostridium fermenticellae]|uniref:Methylated-DNA--protein-cysteine methyltransferase n=1 Tax=Clostridium fermenticellae TaxID=2068654 RepID=A0A386H183_9CLOT|nr:methylated-DNA--[protein]-cysteine S-methyltransferase [Clostridium fermenticellae]AYD39452.1 methylated-DNA--[protein]-cysteine S-methyltransferase [Clostridium fermenticellae]
MVYTTVIQTPLGMVRASAEKNALKGLWFIGQKYYPKNVELWINKPDYRIFKETDRWLKNYFSGRKNLCLPKLEPEGTKFQRDVWNVLLQIPYGKVITYGEIAKKIAELRAIGSMSAQAVGGAVGHNPISILIPCHRVIGSNGNLTGYAGGIQKKRALLMLEKAQIYNATSQENSL